MMDLTTHNHASAPGNSPPFPYTDEVAASLQQPPGQCKDLERTLDATVGGPDPELPPSLTRKSAYLTHPHFNRYHSETDLLRASISEQEDDIPF